jgi:hypothetical protein
MAYKPEKWPYKAKGALEDSLSHLRNIERETASAQQAVIDGKTLEVMKKLSDIRTQAMLAHSILVGAQAGQYAE